MKEVVQRIERIKSVFLETQLFYVGNDDTESLTAYLENIPSEFRSIAYESASMAIAIKDFAHGGELNNWLHYVHEPAKAHQAQVYVGLGWAIAKSNLPFLQVVEKIETRYYHRVADGCGYYDGSFRQRQTVLNQQIPAYLPEAAMPMYDQGLGRSLWYSCQADIDKVRTKIESFSRERQADLWRGIGIAVAYVGGCDDEYLQTLLKYAVPNSVQLACGAALAARSRMYAKTMTPDTNRCSRLWFALTAGETNIFSSVRVTVAEVDNETVYINWIKQIEQGLANSFTIESG